MKGFRQTNPAYREDLLLAKRLQAEFDRETLQNDRINDQPPQLCASCEWPPEIVHSRSNGAGPSSSGTASHDPNMPISNEDETKLAEDLRTNRSVLLSYSLSASV